MSFCRGVRGPRRLSPEDAEENRRIAKEREKRAKLLPANVRGEMQLGRFKVFKAQDEEKGHFDCTIKIGEKKLLVHKFFLASASETFAAMFADRWDKTKNEPVIITDYSYESFYEFITFIYSGDCKFTEENVFALTDMAEFHGVQLLKNRCQQFLSSMLKRRINPEKVEEWFDFGQKYSMKEFLSNLKSFIRYDYGYVLRADGFVEHKKTFIGFLSEILKYSPANEKFFDAAFKWAHYHTSKKKAEDSSDQDLKDLIKAELDGILSNINFSSMTFEFIKESVLDKQFLFPPSELYKILSKCDKKRETEYDECFKILYEIAESEVIKKSEVLKAENFVRIEAVKTELSEVLSEYDFYYMSFNFLMDFVVDRAIYFSLDLVFSFTKIIDNLVEQRLEGVYQLAQKRVLKRQELFPDPHFILKDAIIKELDRVRRRIVYYNLSEGFLNDFVVANGIISEEQALRIHDVSVKVGYDDQWIYGSFNDENGMIKECPRNLSQKRWQTDLNIVRICDDEKHEIPSSPSTVTKLEGIEWYLCLERDRVLSVKHESLLDETDYLIAHMKSPSAEFRLNGIYIKSVIRKGNIFDD